MVKYGEIPDEALDAMAAAATAVPHHGVICLTRIGPNAVVA
jgi:hypothetical protein